MSSPGADLLRRDLLREVSVLVVTASGEDGDGAAGPDGEAVFETCSGLGADMRLHRASGGDLAMPDVTAAGRDAFAGQDVVAHGREALAGRSAPELEALAVDVGLDVLVIDGQALFMAAGLDGCLDGAWQATHTVVNRAFLTAAAGEPGGGRIVYLAPRPSAGPEADAARAGLENLARTLSIEWARYGVTVVTIAPGDATAPGEAATLAAYLASAAGAYFSGCQLDLRGP
jgi:NAD(P)-dependent dehydrogenase (short-subunit alcohol dehydrogenase family)